MVRSLEPDLSVRISRRRWRCVVDPHLCLSHDGAAFIRGLAGHAEIWLGTEFLNILDSWLLYDREPSALMWSNGAGPDADEVRQALRIWQGLRDTAGPGSGRLFWVRDAVRESCLPVGMDESLVPHWEAMAEALDERLSRATETSGPMVAATRDAAALTALLPGSVALPGRSWRPAAVPSSESMASAMPAPGTGRRSGLDRTRPADADAGRGRAVRVPVERAEIGHRAYRCPRAQQAFVRTRFGGGGEDGGFLAELEPRPVKGAWEDALAFWYDLAGENYGDKWER